MSYLIAAYLIVWIVLFIYIFTLYSKQKRLKSEIDNLKQIIKEKVRS